MKGQREPGTRWYAAQYAHPAIAGEGLREFRPLHAGSDERVDAHLPLVNEVHAQSRQGAVDASPCRRRSSRALQGCQGAHDGGGGRQLDDGDPLGGQTVIALVGGLRRVRPPPGRRWLRTLARYSG
jgi:hypothetical protein